MSKVAHIAAHINGSKSSNGANTKALIMVAQEQALNTRAVAHQIYHTVQNPRCRNCAHIIIGCSKLVGTEYNNVASIIHGAICTEYNLEHSKDWWVRPEKVVSNDQAKSL